MPKPTKTQRKRKFSKLRHRAKTIDDMPRIFEFSAPVKPVPKGRPRFSRFHVYTPPRTADYEAAIAAAARVAMGTQVLFEEPLRVSLRFEFAGDHGTLPTAPRDGDADNLSKSVLDALNGIVYGDDRLIVAMSVEKLCAEQDCVRVRVESYEESKLEVARLLARAA